MSNDEDSPLRFRFTSAPPQIAGAVVFSMQAPDGTVWFVDVVDEDGFNLCQHAGGELIEEPVEDGVAGPSGSPIAFHPLRTAARYPQAVLVDEDAPRCPSCGTLIGPVVLRGGRCLCGQTVRTK